MTNLIEIQHFIARTLMAVAAETLLNAGAENGAVKKTTYFV